VIVGCLSAAGVWRLEALNFERMWVTFVGVSRWLLMMLVYVAATLLLMCTAVTLLLVVGRRGNVSKIITQDRSKYIFVVASHTNARQVHKKK
jgi:hypothetical protein